MLDAAPFVTAFSRGHTSAGGNLRRMELPSQVGGPVGVLLYALPGASRPPAPPGSSPGSPPG